MMNKAHERIDAHVHLWRLDRGDYDWITDKVAPLQRDFLPDDLTPVLDGAGIDRVVLVQAAPTVAETRFLLGIAEHTPWVAGVVGWVDLEQPAAADEIAALATDEHLRAIRPMIQDIPALDWMLQSELQPGLRAVESLGLAFDCLVYPEHLPYLLRLLDRHPDLRAVVDHAAKPPIAAGQFDTWAWHIREIARETGAWCKLSGLVTEAGAAWSVEQLKPYVLHLLECFGPDRLMFGSDWPVMTLCADYPRWIGAAEELLVDLLPEEQRSVFGANACAFYRLPEATGRSA
jgi:L-fuconolactonase